MSVLKRVIAITAGDVAGIGPEVIIRAIAHNFIGDKCRPVLIGHPQIFRQAAEMFGFDLRFFELEQKYETVADFQRALYDAGNKGLVPCWNSAGDAVLQAPVREVSAPAGDAAFQYLASAIRLAQSDYVDAIVTAPLNKEALHLAGHHYPGHTEILAEKCGVSDFAMMLHLPETALAPWRSMLRGSGRAAEADEPVGSGISIAHVTLHTSVASVPGLLTMDGVSEKIGLMAGFLQQIRCRREAIAVCALNPHGGENGLFGDEEQRIIRPAVEHSRKHAANVTGPLPVDTLIRRAMLGEFDGVVAMYHDQGHIPIKLIGFDSAVNITLGLPIVRTSPTHGTAFDRAWNPATPADCSGMKEAIRMAILLSENSGT
jgi:4-phospho-D-threonate 3-dehydrogenase / 4-phospho-D-erythronate 3-dehydrogenase